MLGNDAQAAYFLLMVVPAILFLLSCLGLAASWNRSEFFLLAQICALASLALLVLGAVKYLIRRKRTGKAWVVVDGSNVMYWRDGVPKLETVFDVVHQLIELGYTPGVMFDANAGYLLKGRYMHDKALGQWLGLPEGRVMVVPKGVPADPFILRAARDINARIVTNDQFRDWAEAHPEVARDGFLIKGGYRAGSLWLGLTP